MTHAAVLSLSFILFFFILINLSPKMRRALQITILTGSLGVMFYQMQVLNGLQIMDIPSLKKVLWVNSLIGAGALMTGAVYYFGSKREP